MTPEDKNLLIQDLCARLPYGVYIKHTPIGITGKLNNINVVHIYNDTNSVQEVEATTAFFGEDCLDITYFKPYLRPMSSMTPEEFEEYTKLIKPVVFNKKQVNIPSPESFDYLNKKMFDYRGLIPKGLALVAPDDMYK